jgi:very-short-patch-repair endonuclease
MAAGQAPTRLKVASPVARRLRRNQTEAEQHLWSRLRRNQLDGFRFHRQVQLGDYIVDFACLSEKLIVKIDGGQHSHEVETDAERPKWLEAQGFRVLRFWNNEVFENTSGVLKAISRALRQISSG